LEDSLIVAQELVEDVVGEVIFQQNSGPKYEIKGILGWLNSYVVTPRAIWHHLSHFECVLYKTLRHQIFNFA